MNIIREVLVSIKSFSTRFFTGLLLPEVLQVTLTLLLGRCDCLQNILQKTRKELRFNSWLIKEINQWSTLKEWAILFRLKVS